MDSPEGSVIQGSKMSGTLYNIYVNEIPDIHKLINHKFFKKITNRVTQYNYKNIEHVTYNYIDDSNNIISSIDHSHLKHYLENYYLLIHEYYNINKLKINPDKNKIIIIHQNKYNNIFKNFSFKAKNYTIHKSNCIKILGTYISSDLKLDKEIGKLTANLHSRLNNLNTISQYTDFKSRRDFTNAFIIGKLNYILPLYSIAPNYILNKIHKVLMRAARNTIGNYCYKKSCSYILNKCQWLSIEKMVSYSGIYFIYKVISNKEPNSMLSMFKTKKSKRNISKWYTAYQPKTKLMKNFIIYINSKLLFITKRNSKLQTVDI